MIFVFFLSLIQGITEFIPVSSSSHLIIISNYFDYENQSLTLDVSLHIGSLIAVVAFFYKDLINIFQKKDLFLKIFIASIPVMTVGFFLIKTNLISKFRDIEVIGWMTLIFGIFLLLSDKFELKRNIKNNFSLKFALIIGFFQILSLIPGVSRSGITISAARMLKFKRYDAGIISFLLSIPTLGAVSIFGLNNIINSENLGIFNLNFIAILCSFLFSFITIKYFLKFLKKFSLKIFFFYRLILGIILLSLVYL
tara:strand:+ start:1090 stop:1848 length:759 start_codon:yes stop_codon:yes gene_type:complete